MAVEKQPWKKAGAKGVEYREHPTRKHGVKRDRYFRLRYRRDGKTVTETLGWASEGMTESKAVVILAGLKEAIRTGSGEQSLVEKRQLEQERRQAEEAAQARAAADNRTFIDIFENEYYPAQQASDKKPQTIRAEQAVVRKWLSPTLHEKALKDISSFDLEKIKSIMAKAGKKPRTIEHTLAVFRQIHNYATHHGFTDSQNPISKVKLPRRDNRRLAFLSHEQAAALLEALGKRSQDLHDQALLSLHTGARAGEIFRLKWQDIDLEHESIHLLDTKNGMTRQAVMTTAVKIMLNRREPGRPGMHVFIGRGGQPVKEVSRTFERVVEELGFNEGIEDNRQRFTFHSLRHTFASWMAMSGADLMTLKEAMGHKTLQMTLRYSHLMPSHLKKAVAGFEASMPDALAVEQPSKSANVVSLSHNVVSE